MFSKRSRKDVPIKLVDIERSKSVPPIKRPIHKRNTRQQLVPPNRVNLQIMYDTLTHARNKKHLSPDSSSRFTNLLSQLLSDKPNRESKKQINDGLREVYKNIL